MAASIAARPCPGLSLEQRKPSATLGSSARRNPSFLLGKPGLASAPHPISRAVPTKGASGRRPRSRVFVAATFADPRVEVEKPQRGFNQRQLFASVEINAPAQTVWDALTSYDSLQDFIPGLKENKVLEERVNGALLLQVGEEDLALGVKFAAKVILEIEEHPRGVPASRIFDPEGDGDGKLPEPRDPWGDTGSRNHRDISFELLEGDLQGFDGIWRISPGATGPSSCRLSYSVMVKPGPLLPVRLVEPRVRGEIINNLKAVRAYAEAQASSRKVLDSLEKSEGVETVNAV